MLLGASHIDHVDRLRAGSTGRVLPHAVMAPSTVGVFLELPRFFGHFAICYPQGGCGLLS